MAAVTIGAREPLNATICLAPYDPAWPSTFELIASRVRAALAENALLLEHVGSTSVPGLSAKPIVDMVLGVAHSTDEPAYVPQLAAHGFVLRIREPNWFEHRLFKRADVECHLHVFSIDCEEIGRMLAFRDRLRAHQGEREKYESVKRDLASRTWRHMQHYADAKSAIVREILGRALGAQP